MAKSIDKLAEYQFTIPTTLSFEEIKRRTQTVVSGFKVLTRQMNYVDDVWLEEERVGGIHLSVVNLWLFEQAKLRVGYYYEGEQAFVFLEVIEFMVAQDKFLYFIPVSPKSVPALNDVHILSCRLKRAFEKELPTEANDSGV